MKSDLKDFLQTFAAEGKVSLMPPERLVTAAFWEILSRLGSVSVMSHDRGLVL